MEKKDVIKEVQGIVEHMGMYKRKDEDDFQPAGTREEERAQGIGFMSD